MSLASIYQQIIEHPENNWAKEKGYVPVYTVSENSKIMIVGQAPGIKAQTSLTPWNDVSGDRLRDWLGVSREQFYNTGNFALVPMDLFYPGKGKHGDLPPRKGFAAHWHPRILAELTNLQLILLVGNYAQSYYLGTSKKRNLTETVLSYKEYAPKYFPFVHPSPLNFRWRAINPWFEAEVVPYARERVQTILNL